MANDWSPMQMSGTLMRGPVEFAMLLVDSWAGAARMYWGLWGPLGQPAIEAVETLAEMQRSYLRWLGGAIEDLTPFT